MVTTPKAASGSLNTMLQVMLLLSADVSPSFFPKGMSFTFASLVLLSNFPSLYSSALFLYTLPYLYSSFDILVLNLITALPMLGAGRSDGFIVYFRILSV